MNLKLKKNKIGIYILMILYPIVLLFIYQKDFEILLFSYALSILAPILSLYRIKIEFLDLLLCYLIFSLLSLLLKKDLISIFYFSYFLMNHPYFVFCNKLSLKKHSRGVLGMGSISLMDLSSYTIIDFFYSLGSFSLVIIYFFIGEFLVM